MSSISTSIVLGKLWKNHIHLLKKKHRRRESWEMVEIKNWEGALQGKSMLENFRIRMQSARPSPVQRVRETWTKLDVGSRVSLYGAFRWAGQELRPAQRIGHSVGSFKDVVPSLSLVGFVKIFLLNFLCFRNLHWISPQNYILHFLSRIIIFL